MYRRTRSTIVIFLPARLTNRERGAASARQRSWQQELLAAADFFSPPELSANWSCLKFFSGGVCGGGYLAEAPSNGKGLVKTCFGIIHKRPLGAELGRPGRLFELHRN